MTQDLVAFGQTAVQLAKACACVTDLAGALVPLSFEDGDVVAQLSRCQTCYSDSRSVDTNTFPAGKQVKQFKVN